MKTKHKKNSGNKDSKNLFLYGRHACLAALKNKQRIIINLYITKNFNAAELGSISTKPRIVINEEINRLVPENSVHQGIVLETKPLADPGISYIIKHGGTIVFLDQVTDPQNIGAILRTAAAFSVTAIILPKDNAPAENATLAKTASGALEIVPIIKVTNLVRAMDELKKSGYWFIGMDGATQTDIGSLENLGEKKALVMGAEGSGLRRLTREACDYVVKIPISKNVESLNVSNAAAIALYCLEN